MFSANASQVSNDVKYIEDFCSVYLRTGTGASQTVTTGVKENTGALVISKSRSAATDWAWYDTFRGATYDLVSNSTAAQTTQSQGLTAFNADGHTWGTLAKINTSGATYVDTVLKPTPKFFDVVTFTSNGSGGGTFNHSLGSTPGCVILKSTGVASSWIVYHRSTGVSKYLELQSTAAEQTGTNWISVDSTSVTVGSGWLGANRSIVAYLFAHNAGGFGLTGTDNVISCGSITLDGSNYTTVDLGYEPQWVLIKNATTTSSSAWEICDNMRGMPATSGENYLLANSSAAEGTGGYNLVRPTSTGFSANSSAGTYIYIAIRRGPMKVPTSGTSVFDIQTYTGTQVARTITTANTVDLSYTKSRDTAGTRWNWTDRLRGATRTIDSSLTAAEASDTTGYTSFAVQKGYTLGAGDIYDVNTSGRTYASWNLTRAPRFFDEVCYTGTGSLRTVSHNLGAVPELLIVKRRDTAEDWNVYSATTGNAAYLRLNTTAAVGTAGADALWGSTTPTSSVFTVKTSGGTNASGGTFVAYLFATCAGVSKVGSYTGNGSTQTINCGFTGGARFVLIKQTTIANNEWFVWDTARGIVAGNDPFLALNRTWAEDSSTDSIDPDSTGFIVNQNGTTSINSSGAEYIFLAIA